MRALCRTFCRAGLINDRNLMHPAFYDSHGVACSAALAIMAPRTDGKIYQTAGQAKAGNATSDTTAVASTLAPISS